MPKHVWRQIDAHEFMRVSCSHHTLLERPRAAPHVEYALARLERRCLF
jgi:hypothetical protein